MVIVPLAPPASSSTEVVITPTSLEKPQRARLEASPPEEPSPSPAAGAHSASSGPVPASTPTDGAARTAGVVSHDGAIDSSA